MILWRDWSLTSFPGIFARGMVSMVPRDPSGVPIYPQNLPGRGFTGIPPEPKKSRGAPGPLGGLPFVPLWACGLLQGSVAWPQALCISSYPARERKRSRLDQERSGRRGQTTHRMQKPKCILHHKPGRAGLPKGPCVLTRQDDSAPPGPGGPLGPGAQRAHGPKGQGPKGPKGQRGKGPKRAQGPKGSKGPEDTQM